MSSRRKGRSVSEERRSTRKDRLAASMDLSEEEITETSDNGNTESTINQNQNQENDLRQFLKEKGYICNRGIYIGDGTLAYIKAHILGNKVYIDLDTMYSNVKPSESDLSIKKVVRVSSQDIKPNTDYCTSLDVCGVAYVCNEGFCTLRRNEDTFEVEEEDFYMTTAREERTAFTKDPASAYPIVKISEIMANNFEVIKNIQNASQRLRIHADKIYFERKMQLKAQIRVLNSLTSRLDEVLDKSHSTVTSLRLRHMNLIDKKNIMIPPHPQELDLYETHMKGLDQCASLHDLLISNTSILEDWAESLAMLNKELQQLCDDVEDRYT